MLCELVIADMEGVTGSYPIAPTTTALISGNAVEPCASFGSRGEECRRRLNPEHLTTVET
jgi:hypothetical protein